MSNAFENIVQKVKRFVNRMKLASKLTMVLALVLVGVFAVLIVSTAVLSGNAIRSAISGELDATSQGNGYQVQQFFDAAKRTASDIQTYLEQSYKKAYEAPSLTKIPETLESAKLCKSDIYNKVLSPLKHDVELFISEAARNTAVNNEDIVGVGVMFEQYKFQSDLEDYAFYVDQTNVDDDIEPLSTYAEYSALDYYQTAMTTLQPTVTAPYAKDGILVVTYAVPIIYDDEFLGVVSADINVASFGKVNATSEQYPSMYAAVFTDKGEFVYSSKSDDYAVDLSDLFASAGSTDYALSKMAEGVQFDMSAASSDGQSNLWYFAPIDISGTTWWTMTVVSEADSNASVNTTVLMLVIMSAVALLLILFTVAFMLRKTLSPMAMVVDAANQISRGDLNVSLESKTQDEVGILSDTFRVMSENLSVMVHDVQYLLGTMADGDFTAKTKAQRSYVGEFHQFLISIDKLNRTLSNTLNRINEASDQVAAGSRQMAEGAQSLSIGASEQADSIGRLAITIDSIAGQIRKTSDNAMEARTLTTVAGEDAMRCSEQMKKMNEAMDDITASSQQISEIIKTIEDIAFQTNILALNAAVEAARAGDAGRGFAVVANEVRKLANKSSEASKSTAALISKSLEAVENGTFLANETAESLSAVVEKTENIAKMVEDISADAEKQAEMIGEVTQDIDQISNVVQTNSATAEESAASSEELSSQAQLLKELVSKFTLSDGDASVFADDIDEPFVEPEPEVQAEEDFIPAELIEEEVAEESADDFEQAEMTTDYAEQLEQDEDDAEEFSEEAEESVDEILEELEQAEEAVEETSEADLADESFEEAADDFAEALEEAVEETEDFAGEGEEITEEAIENAVEADDEFTFDEEDEFEKEFRAELAKEEAELAAKESENSDLEAEASKITE